MNDEKYYKIKVERYDYLDGEIKNCIVSLQNGEYTSAAFFLGKVYGSFKLMIEKDEE